MTEAVIVSTARSPIGRAMKGSLTEVRPDDLTATIVKAALDKVPELDRTTIDDLILGCGQPAGESGFNIARAAAILAGLDDVPGVTINRYCSSSLQAIRMAAHAIKAGEGDVFVAAGVETVSRFMERHGRQRPAQPAVRRRRGPHRRGGQRGRLVDAARGPARHLHRHGPDRRERALKENVCPADMDEFAARSQQLASANQENGYWDGEITPITTPSGTVVSKDDGPRAGTTVEKLAELKPVFRPDGEITAGNACPLNDGAAAVIVMSDTWPPSWASPRSPASCRRASPA